MLLSPHSSHCSGTFQGRARQWSDSPFKEEHLAGCSKTLSQIRWCTAPCNYATSLFTMIPFINPVWLILLVILYCNSVFAVFKSSCAPVVQSAKPLDVLAPLFTFSLSHTSHSVYCGAGLWKCSRARFEVNICSSLAASSRADGVFDLSWLSTRPRQTGTGLQVHCFSLCVGRWPAAQHLNRLPSRATWQI